MPHPVRTDKRFKRRLAKKDVAMQAAIAECINMLLEDPRHPGLHTKRVQGTDGIWEARIDRANRLTFEWDDDTIVLRNHCNHEVMSRNP